MAEWQQEKSKKEDSDRLKSERSAQHVAAMAG
jgi:hypothetical protein